MHCHVIRRYYARYSETKKLDVSPAEVKDLVRNASTSTLGLGYGPPDPPTSDRSKNHSFSKRRPRIITQRKSPEVKRYLTEV
eukprot:3327179-Rhodomonas_salina.1